MYFIIITIINNEAWALPELSFSFNLSEHRCGFSSMLNTESIWDVHHAHLALSEVKTHNTKTIGAYTA